MFNDDEFSLEYEDFDHGVLHAKEEETFRVSNSCTFDFSGHLAKETNSVALLRGKGFVNFNRIARAHMNMRMIKFEDCIDLVSDNHSKLSDTLLPKVQKVARDLMNQATSPSEAQEILDRLPIVICIFPLTREIFRQIKSGGVTRIRQREENDDE